MRLDPLPRAARTGPTQPSDVNERREGDTTVAVGGEGGGGGGGGGGAGVSSVIPDPGRAARRRIRQDGDEAALQRADERWR